MPRIPTSRLGRTAKLGGLVAGQGARWLGNRAANTVRSDERADEARGEWALRAADELVEQLGQMKGAAMKIGQVLSTVDWDVVPEGEREAFKERLAALRDDVTPVDFKAMRKVVEQDLGGKVADHFAEFSDEAFAAASIGQVYRARTHDGRDVAVKVQYPGIAEAVETDLRNMNLLFPLIRRLAPGLDAKAIAAELRERIGEELDYEIEAQHQRTVGPGLPRPPVRRHPRGRHDPVDAPRARHRVRRRRGLRGGQALPTRRARPLRRDRLPVLLRAARARAHRRGRPAPGQLPAAATTAASASWTSASCARSRPTTSRASGRWRGPSSRATRTRCTAGWRTSATCPTPATSSRERVLEQLRDRRASGTSRPASAGSTPSTSASPMEVGSSPRSPYFD